MTASAQSDTVAPAEVEDRAAPFDVLLADAVVGPVRRFLPGAAGLRLAGALATHPDVAARRTRDLAVDLVKVAAGRSDRGPDPKDRRFQDPAWQGNPLLRRLLQAYLAAAGTVEGLVDDADLDWRSATRLHLLAENLVAALAPSNNPLLNPTVLKATIDTGGRNLIRGAGSLVRDLAQPPRIPRMVDERPFRVGGNLGVTPGAVVLRTPMFELLQYQPQTPRVRAVPLLVIPPTINKFYIADLAPDRSMVEHFVRSGQQVFLVSWRNPDARQADWGLDAYGRAILDALDATARISGMEQAAVLALCSGGILAAMTVAHLAARGDLGRIAAFSLGVTVLDQGRGGVPNALLDRDVARRAAARSARRGYLDGRALAEVFAWLRPDDLVWNYWVNNYLLGQDPPAFDILAWNADTTRMTAALHRDFLQLGVDNALVRPGEAKILGTPVDLAAITTDAYAIAGIADHICPWQNCYRSAQLLGGKTRFVLSTSGHVAALINPTTNPKARFQVTDDASLDAASWLATAPKHQGSWWTDYVEWLRERTGPELAAPDRLGGRGLEPLAPAPGSYVCER